MSTITCCVAWDAAAQGHAYLNGGDLTFVGRPFAEETGATISWLMPGLIDIRSHPSTEPFFSRCEGGTRSAVNVYERSLRTLLRGGQGVRNGKVLMLDHAAALETPTDAR
jgi:hypothetical protein